MTGPAFDRRAFAQALTQVGVRRGDVLFSHSNIGYFGFPAEGRTPQIVCDTLLGATLEALGPDGTLVVPTFTYSFCKSQPFDPDATPSTCGMFTEWLRKHPDAKRSQDPIFSVAAIGARAAELTANAPTHCFGPDSFWARFLALDGIVCNWNFDAGSTYLHFVERCLRVPYRYDKVFWGTFLKKGVATPGAAVFFCQDLSNPETSAVFEPFDKLTRARGIAQSAAIGRGAIVALRARAAYDLVEEKLREHSWILTEAGKTNREASIALTPPKAQPLDLPLQDVWDALAELPRDIVSPGMDVALATLTRHFPLTIHEVATGTDCQGRIIPEQWECTQATLHESANAPALPLRLAAVRYSTSFEGVVSRAELLAHTHADPMNADGRDRPSPHVIGGRGDGGEGGPYLTSSSVESARVGGTKNQASPLTPVPSPSADAGIAHSCRSRAEGEGRSRSHAAIGRLTARLGCYERTWGLCLPASELASLTRDSYYVRLQTRTRFGSMKIGEWVLPGASSESVLLVGVLSGIDVASVDACRSLLEHGQVLAGMTLPYTFRILLVAEDFGLPGYLHLHPDLKVRSVVRWSPYVQRGRIA